MDNEMIVIKKANIDELVEQLKLFNENIKKLNAATQEEIFYTRKEVEKHYKLSTRAVGKIFNALLKDKVVNIGKSQKIAKMHIDNLLKNGVTQKFV